ncbi:MAG: DUF362 domain-containing protein [Phycisphaerae bacterium]|nr:DUF362 domain-containing protein [Phycisphaerae bacterium]
MNRRDFLKHVAAAAAFAAANPWRSLLAQTASAPSSLPATMTARKSPVHIIRYRKSQQLIKGHGISRWRLREALIAGFCELAQCPVLPKALQAFFQPNDVIGFKFDNTLEYLLATNRVFSEEIFRIFLQNGFQPHQLLFLGATPADPLLPKPRKPNFGWTDQIDFGSGKDQFTAALDDVTALVNVPLLRADAISGISVCLRNATYGFLRHPARFYRNACSPYIVDIYRLPIIRDKIRLHLVNAVKVPIRTDVLEHDDAVSPQEALLFSRDAVATDAVAFEIIERLRANAGLQPLLESDDFLPLLVEAARAGLGKYHPDQIDLKPLWLE